MKATDWTDRLKAQLETHTSPVDPALWEAVRAGLPQAPHAGVAGSSFRLKPKPLLWTAGLAAAVALGVFWGLHLGRPAGYGAADSQELAVTLAAPSETRPQVAAIVNPQVPALPQIERKRVPAKPEAAPEVAPAIPKPQPASEPEPKKVADKPEAGKQNVGKQNVGKQNVGKETVGKDNAGKNNPAGQALQWEEPRKAGRSQWDMAVFAGNAAQRDRASRAGYGAVELLADAAPPDLSTKYFTANAYSQLVEEVRNQETRSDEEHRMPLSVGLSLRWRPLPRWGVETGLQYTFLAAEYTSGTPRSSYQASQQLHYVGLPLQLSYRFLEARNVELYASAGLTLDRLVACHRQKQYIFGAQTGQRERETLHPAVWQLSAGAQVGLQYSFYRNIGLYAQAGLSRYFDDGSRLATLYAKHPTLFHAQVGLRFTLTAGM